MPVDASPLRSLLSAEEELSAARRAAADAASRIASAERRVSDAKSVVDAVRAAALTVC